MTTSVVRRGLLPALAVLLCVGRAAAAQAPEPPSVDDLKAPPSPAMTVLGLAPTSVDRPQGVRPIIASIVAASKDTGFPRNYSVEVAPYWMAEPALSFADYYRRTARNWYRQLSVSVAMTPMGETTTDGTAIGLGVKTLPLPGKAHPQLAALQKKLESLQAARLALIGTDAKRPRLIELLHKAQAASDDALVGVLDTPEIDAIVESMRGLDNARVKLEIQAADLAQEAKDDLADRSLSEAERKRREDARAKSTVDLQARLAANRRERAALATRIMTEVQQSKAADQMTTTAVLQTLSTRLEDAQAAETGEIAAEMRATALKIQALDRQRVGPMMTVAAATAWQIPQNDTRQLGLAATSFWFTPGYRMLTCPVSEDDGPCSSSVEVLGVVRYRDDKREDPGDRTWDIGARVVWQPVKPLAVSAEYVGRAAADIVDDPGSRIVGVVEFQFNQTTYLYASFGRDFKEQGIRRTLVSIVGLTFGFGKQPIVTPPIR